MTAKLPKLSEDEQIQLDYERTVQHILFYGSSGFSIITYLRPDGVSTYKRPDGTSSYERP